MGLLEQTLDRIQPLDLRGADLAQARLDQLTKPRGSLGRLEELAARCALITGQERPRVDGKVLFVFCADHGVSAAGVSAYPREVTAQMVHNFLCGGAAITVLARQLGITVQVVDLGVDAVLGVGEMGIGNSTAATALLSAFSGIAPEELTGSGTGIDETTRRKKVEIVRSALNCNRPDPADPLGVLAKLGGYEIAGIVGVCLAGAAWRVPVVIDGFIATAGAWVACALHPVVKDCQIFAHLSAEQGHDRVLAALQVQPLLNLGMRLGEGTGAALGMGLVESAVRLFNEMATFAEAGVTNKD